MGKAAFSRRALALVLLGASAPPALADDTFRCGNELIELGATQSEVLAQCGEPTAKAEETQDVRSGPQVVGTATVARWTYESYSATRVLVFDGDRLVSIQ